MRSFFHRPLTTAFLVSLLIHGVFLLSGGELLRASPEQSTAAVLVTMHRGGGPDSGTPEARMERTSSGGNEKQGRKAITHPADQPLRNDLVNESGRESPLLPVDTTSAAAAADGLAISEHSPPLRAAAGGGESGGRKSTEIRDGVQANDLRQYRVSLASAAGRFRRYPVLARERGWEGTVDIAVSSTDDYRTEVRISRSSGHTMLDEQAYEMVARAARITAMPEGLKGKGFSVTLPVTFSLENDQ